MYQTWDMADIFMNEYAIMGYSNLYEFALIDIG